MKLNHTQVPRETVVGVETERKQGDIQMALDELDKATLVLGESLSSLSRILEPVIRPEPEENQKTCDRVAGSCFVSEEIRRVTDRIYASTSYINSIRDSVEL